MITDQEEGLVTVKHVIAVMQMPWNAYMYTTFVDEDLTVHNHLHNTRKIMHTQCHAWFHDIVRIWVRPICLFVVNRFKQSSESQVIKLG